MQGAVLCLTLEILFAVYAHLRAYRHEKVIQHCDAAAQRTLAQFLEELMSTRLGVRREGEIVSAAARTADDGKEYYDVEVWRCGCRQLRIPLLGNLAQLS